MGRMDRIGRENYSEWTTCSLKVQLQDETGRASAGFGAEDYEPIAEDALDTPVRGRGSGDVRSLTGEAGYASGTKNQFSSLDLKRYIYICILNSDIGRW